MLKDYWDIFTEWLTGTLKSRIFWLGVILTALFMILVVRLYYLQILNGSSYYDSYVTRTKKEILTSASRGNIYDRNGILLAGNEVTYNLTIKDTNDYTKSDGSFNKMILRLVDLIHKYDNEVVTSLPVIIGNDGKFTYSGKESAVRQLIKDTYGTSYIETQNAQGVDVYSFDAETVIQRLMKTAYDFTSKWEDAETLDKEDILAICNVRYAMISTTFSKYKSTTICSDISEELRTAVLENQSELLGVEIEESEKRVYPDGVYFSNIIGYTGKPNAEELEELKEKDSTYEASDYIGKDGIEQYYEEYLSGTKGTDTVYLNNMGVILDTIDSVASVKGDDVYLSIDHDLTIAAYNLIEQRLAAVILEKLTIEDFNADDTTLAGEFKIPVKDVYFQMINNNILDYSKFSDEEASDNEKQLDEKMQSEKSTVINHIIHELNNADADPMSELNEDMQDYMSFVYDYLKSKGILIVNSIDTSDSEFTEWKDNNSSLCRFLHYAVSQGWVDASKLNSQNKFLDSDSVYEEMINCIKDDMPLDDDFVKLIYKKLINNEIIAGNEICLALINQGILDESAETYQKIENGSDQDAFDFIKQKIANIDITPAQIALDPCTGSSIITDTDTGEVLALVSYPGYDINKFSGTIDSTYWNKLINDMSEPLYDKATQVRTAPGSTYKLVTTTAGLEENVISSTETINCVGTFDKVDHPKCWIARESNGMHGPLNTTEAISKSCNFYFYEVGYRLSLDENGKFNAQLGLDRLAKYADLYGFSSKSGLEIAENVSQISTEYPVTSAIGQGSNNFTAVSLSRYVTALATRGNLYEYKLLSKICDSNGNTVVSYTPSAQKIEEVHDTTWDVIANGMYGVAHGAGTTANAFEGLQIDIAGKSGSVQENLKRANHAIFISYGPYDDPEITVTVSIPHGYMAYNAAMVCRYIYQYYFDYLSMDDILNNSYSITGGSTVYSD